MENERMCVVLLHSLTSDWHSVQCTRHIPPVLSLCHFYTSHSKYTSLEKPFKKTPPSPTPHAKNTRPPLSTPCFCVFLLFCSHHPTLSHYALIDHLSLFSDETFIFIRCLLPFLVTDFQSPKACSWHFCKHRAIFPSREPVHTEPSSGLTS